MSAAPARRHLVTVPTNTPAVPVAGRTRLERLVAGEPVYLSVADCSLVEFSNTDWTGLDPEVDPDDYTAAEVMLSYYHEHVGLERRTQGDRAQGTESDLRRYLIPWAVEHAASRTAGERGIGHLRIETAKAFPRMLAGDRPLPAATVAADLLGLRGRTAVSCLWLTPEEAARVSEGGEAAVTRAVSEGTLRMHDSAAGDRLIFAADLRTVGLLREPATPHGLAHGTAKNIVGLLKEVLSHGQDLGAHMRGNFAGIRAMDPVDKRRKRAPRGRRARVTLADTALVCTRLTPLYQVALWLIRLTGARISEAFGLTVGDLHREKGRWWLDIHKQGGRLTYERDEDGGLVKRNTKKGTKSVAGVRRIPISDQLAALLLEMIRIFHTDPVSGKVRKKDRLIPGIQADDTSGASAFRAALKVAVAELRAAGHDVPDIKPHEQRANLITDLKDAGIKKRLARAYAGHEKAKDVHDGYDLGPVLTPVAKVLSRKVVRAGLEDLRVPTGKSQAWGTASTLGRAKYQLEAELRASGWQVDRRAGDGASRLDPADAPAARELVELTTGEVARRAGCTRGTAQRWLREGTIPGHEVTQGNRTIWVAYETDVNRYLAERHAVTLNDLAAEVGWTYHQLYALLHTLDLMPAGHVKGRQLRLTPQTAEAVRTEVQRRQDAARRSMLVTEAAVHLGLARVAVETLIRQGLLSLVPAPDDTRHRYVSVASVEAFDRTHPAAPPVGPGDLVVPVADARRALAVNRPTMTKLTTSRILASTAVNRRQCITLTSALHYLKRHPRPGAEQQLTGAAFSA